MILPDNAILPKTCTDPTGDLGVTAGHYFGFQDYSRVCLYCGTPRPACMAAHHWVRVAFLSAQ